MTWIDGYLTETVTLLRAEQTVDRYGNTRLAWDDPTETGTTGLVQRVLQRSREGAEVTVDDQVARVVAVAFLPAGTDVTDVDRLRHDGVTYRVAAVARKTFAGREHLEVLLAHDSRSLTATDVGLS